MVGRQQANRAAAAGRTHTAALDFGRVSTESLRPIVSCTLRFTMALEVARGVGQQTDGGHVLGATVPRAA